jgi:Domain of unknown function (DUF4349)
MKIFKFVFVLSLGFLTSCAEPAANSDSSIPREQPLYQKGVTSDTESGGRGNGESEKLNNPATTQITEQNTQIERKIIRNADLQLETDAPEEAQQKITSIAESKGGFVVESTQSSSNIKSATRDTVMMTVRVPAEKFNETLDEIRKTGSRVIVETVKGTDVTEEFIDIEARLKAKRTLEAQFLEIMKRADSVSAALEVQKQLSEVRAEIEKIEGRKRFLENQASLSTIKIKLQTPLAFSSNSSGFFYRLKESIGNGFDAALSFILGFVTIVIAILPFFILVVLPVFLVLRYFWRKLRRRKTAVEIPAEEIKEEEE